MPGKYWRISEEIVAILVRNWRCGAATVSSVVASVAVAVAVAWECKITADVLMTSIYLGTSVADALVDSG
jgi:hypothetical protein